jgi:acyl-CoA synthetase (AMP-forming)/AMP-acid ligase II/thioesterase domain-containing protein
MKLANPESVISATAELLSGTVSHSTIGREIERQSKTRPDQAALVCTGYAPLSYRELQQQIDKIRTDLRQASFARSARIVVALPSGPHAAVAIVAIACSAVAVPLNPKLTFDEIETCFATLRPDAIVLLRDSESAARHVAEGKGLTVFEATPISEGSLRLKVVMPKSGNIASADNPDPDAPAFILQTSGTMAEPKSIPFSHRNMLAAAARLQAWFKLTPQDRCLSVSPLYYSHGLKVTVFTPLLTGGTVAFPTDSSQLDFGQWFGALKPTWYSAGPTLHRLIFDKAESIPDANSRHSLRFVLSGGAPLPRNILEGLQRTLDVSVVEHYGSSEAAQIAANLPPPGRSKPGTCGIPWPGTVMIVDEDGGKLPPEQQGEILIGGPTLISGYLDAPELNRECFVDGWFKTGDIGSLDDEGFLTLHGRLKDLINRGGEKVSPPELDESLMRHPAVAEAAAFAVPHERLGEDVAAAVVLRPGMSASAAELRTYLSDQLASFKVPRRIFIVEQLPKGSSGKILRRRLTESFGIQMAGPAVASDKPVDNDLLLQLRNLWERLLKCGPLSIDDDFFEKGGDSLLVVDMLCEVERLTGKKVPSLTTILEASTVRKLAQYLGREDTPNDTSLIELRNGGPRNLFLVHDGDGETLLYLHLARRLPEDFSVYGVEPRRMSGVPLAHATIEDIAAFYLEEVRKKQPHGPYLLGGLCSGGIIAYEMATQLERTAERAEVVILLDSAAPQAAKKPWLTTKARLGRLQQALAHRPAANRGWIPRMGLAIGAVSRKLTNASLWEISQRGKRLSVQQRFHLLREVLAHKTAWPSSVPELTTREILTIAEAHYLPGPLSSTPVALVRARTGEGTDTPYRDIYADDTFGWGELAHNLKLIDVDGGHSSMLQEQFVESLVEALKPYVSRSKAVPTQWREITHSVV